MKIKLPKFSTMFARRKKKKLRLSTARRASASGAEFDGEMSEPNMKLSRALLIVLLLHIVAVGGIVAFNAIKSRQGPDHPPVAAPKAQTLASPIPHEEIKTAHLSAAKAEKKSTPDGTKSYTVAKGDTPVTIAKKFKVTYDDLLAANHIDDPRKLKIGQKLIIPATKKTGKKATE
jgi:nucleoid-associated protein YgaU